MLRLPSCCFLLVFVVPAAALAQPVSVDLKHDAPVQALAWSSDGKRLASGDVGGVIRIVEFPSGKELVKIDAGAAVNGVVFSPDGKLLGVKSGGVDGPLSAWDLEVPKKLKQLAFKGYTCNLLAFTPDAQTLIASAPGENMIWNHGKGGGSGSRSGKIPDGSSAAVSPRGSFVAWSNPSGLVQMYTAERKFQRMQLGPTVAFVISPDDKHLAAAAPDKTIRLWEMHGNEIKKYEGMREPATLLHFSGNGKVLVAASPEDPVIRLWDVASTHLRRRVTTGATGIRALALSPDGLSLALASSDRLQVWNVATRDLGDLGKAKPLAAPELKSAWDELASSDPTKADTAFRSLAAAQEHALDFLKEQIRVVAVPPVDWKRVDQFISELDSPTYALRERAMLELSKQGEYIQPALEKYLAAKPKLEGERRARKLLQRLVDPDLTPDRLRCLEAIEIFEILQTKQAIAALDEVARDSLLTQIRLAARDALDRVSRAEKDKDKK